MATFRESPVNRFLLSVLSRWRGEVAAIQDVRRLRDVLRFASVFVITILLPALFLAYFALASIRSEELALDADLRARAAGIEGQVQQELDSVFRRFEERTAQRLGEGGSPLDRLGELSPFLRVAFRLDPSGELAAPFAPPDPQQVLPDNAAFQRPWRRGITAEREDDWATAAEAFALASVNTQNPTLLAEASFAAARNRARLDPRNSVQILSDVYSDYASVRDRMGFRVGDLVVLTQGQLRMASDPEIGAVTLEALVTDILNRRWTLGQPGEPTVARAALRTLPDTTDPDWLARTRDRLNERTAQLRWAETVAGELELLSSQQPGGQGQWNYFSGPNSRALWATVRTQTGEQYLFAFALDDVVSHLRETAGRASAVDAELEARLVPAGQPVVGEPLVQRPLGEQIAFLTLTVSHADPTSLAAQKANRRRARIAIVLLSVFLVFVGVLASARLVGREVESARMKADFAANVSHELRSPITQIRLKAESLQLDLCYDDADRQAHYDAIVHESERLSRLVDNVLDFAAIERGAKRYSFRQDDMAAVVLIQVEATRSTLEQKGMEIELTLPDDLPPVWIDREALGQVLTNLLSNAAKYGSDGGWVGVKVEGTPSGVEISVSDRGIGISAEELPHVFDDFFRSKDPAVRRKKGTGIGLAIVRYIVEAHGGTISVESEAGEGTTFTLSFPLEPPEGAGGVTQHAANPVR
ncbi:MAG: HAMP domain-containing histidine kinase [Alphaproteobacteria bacterium]|nr:HAMP domain-containing histidine kinase [Alphaproteobacteria bacterium]